MIAMSTDEVKHDFNKLLLYLPKIFYQFQIPVKYTEPEIIQGFSTGAASRCWLQNMKL